MQERGDLVQDEAGRWVEGPALDWQALPARVEAVIEERIGRLSEDLRDLLSVASVEGEEFTAQVVARVQDQRERQLLRSLSRELVKRHRLVRERGEDQVGQRLLSRYRFAHALFQHYLYNDLSPGERRLLHGEIAGVLEEIFSGRTEEIAVQLAFHYGRAGSPSRALPYLIQAGHRARAAYANQEAIRYYTEALGILDEHDPQRFELLAARAAVYDLTARRPEQKADIDEMLALAEQQGDEARRCDALLALAGYCLSTDLAAARAPADEALEIARALADPVREARALHCLGEHDHFLGDYQRGRTQLEAATELYVEAGTPAEAARCLSALALTLGTLGESDSAIEAAQRSADLSREAGDRRQEATGLRRIAIAFTNQERHAEALPLAERALALHRELGDRAQECAALNVMGIIKAHLHDHEQSERYFRKSLQVAESLADPIGIQYAIWNLLTTHYYRRGEVQDSLAFFDEYIDKARARNDLRLSAKLLMAKSTFLEALGQYTPALSVLERSLALGEEGLGRQEKADVWGWRGHVQLRLAEYAEARRNLRRAAAVARETGNAEVLGDTLAWEALIALHQGVPEAMRVGLGLVQEALAAYGEHSQHYNYPIAYETAARLRLALGDVPAAEIDSRQALDRIASVPSPYKAEQVHHTHSRILRALGKEAEADEYLQRAYQRVMLVAGKTTDPELKRSWLENVAVNRQIVEEWTARAGAHQ
jgi:tetratricopeptide (TPR) repeat protein